MEPQYIGNIRCVETEGADYTVGLVYDLLLIDGEYYVQGNYNNQRKVARSACNFERWHSLDGWAAFMEVAK